MVLSGTMLDRFQTELPWHRTFSIKEDWWSTSWLGRDLGRIINYGLSKAEGGRGGRKGGEEGGREGGRGGGRKYREGGGMEGVREI